MSEAVAILVSVNYLTGKQYHTVFRYSEGSKNPVRDAQRLKHGIKDDWPEAEGWITGVIGNDAAWKINGICMVKELIGE